jgi:hypothetical protein
LLDPLGEYVPAGHLEHISAPLVSEKEPAGQAVHLIEPGSDQKPALQGSQALMSLEP